MAPRDAQRQPTKVPFRPISGRALAASTDNPATWGSYAEAQAPLSSGPYDGIGCVCKPEQDGIFAIDLDGCIDPETGEISQWANDIVEQIDSRTERSPSGTGLKIFVRGDPNLQFPVKSIKLPDAPKVCAKDPQIKILVNKYTTLTGDHLGGTPQTIEDASGYLNNMARWLAEDRADHVREHSPPTTTPWTPTLLMRAADVIPNDTSVDWNRWKEIGMRFWAATGGSDDGLAAFDLLSRKHPRYGQAETRDCWSEITRSPPTRFSVNSLLSEARRYDRAFPDPASLIGQDVDFSEMLDKASEPEKPRYPRIINLKDYGIGRFTGTAPPPRWLVQGSMIRGETALVASMGGVGKSYLFLNLGLRVGYEPEGNLGWSISPAKTMSAGHTGG